MLDCACSDKRSIYMTAAFYQNAVNLPLPQLLQDLGDPQAVRILPDGQNCHSRFFQERLPFREHFRFLRIR